MKIDKETILELFPIIHPYRFVDRILRVDEDSIEAAYRFTGEEHFFKGHLPGFPIVPGAILQEAAAQVCLLALGMYLTGNGLVTLTEFPTDLMAGKMKDLPGDQGEVLRSLIFDRMATNSPFSTLFDGLFYLVSADFSYKRMVRPSDTIRVVGEKVFFRWNKLKSRACIYSGDQELIAKGTLSGIVVSRNLWKIESLLPV